jgi:hypothetical protein
LQAKSSTSRFDPLKPPQEAAEPATLQPVEFEGAIETASIEVSSSMISEPLKPPQ